MGGDETQMQTPVIPEEIMDMYANIGNAISGGMRDNPLSGYYGSNPQQVAGFNQFDQQGINNLGAFAGATPAGNAAFDYANRLGNMQPFQGVDLSGVQAVGGVDPSQFGSIFGPSQGQGQPRPQWQQPQQPSRRPGGRVSYGPAPDKVRMRDIDVSREEGADFSGGNTGQQDYPGIKPPPGSGGGPGGNVPSRPYTPPSTSAPFKPFQLSPTQGSGGSQQGPSANLGQGPQLSQPQGMQRPTQGGGMSSYRDDLAGFGRYEDSASYNNNALDRDYVESTQIGNPLNNIDFANHPALQSAIQSFQQLAMPGIENQMQASGLGASGAASRAISTGQAQIALPVMQQLMSLELENKGQDVAQRGQTFDALRAQQMLGLEGRNQDLNALLGGRGQDINALLGQRNQDINLALGNQQNMLGQRGQDIGALMDQGRLGLAGQGQQADAIAQAMAGMQGLSQADLQRMLAAQQMTQGYGDLGRGVENQGYEAQYQDFLRQQGLAHDNIFGPLGGIGNTFGTYSRTSGK